MTSQLATSGPASYNLQDGEGGGVKTSYLVCVWGGGVFTTFLFSGGGYLKTSYLFGGYLKTSH